MKYLSESDIYFSDIIGTWLKDKCRNKGRYSWQFSHILLDFDIN